MAYEFDLGDLEGPYTDSEGSQIVEFILGADPEADTVVVMSVILFPTTQEDMLELCFGIRTKTGPDLSRVSEPDYGKEGAEKYIPRERRADVLAKIKDSVSSIVSAAMPSLIAMETFYPDLPPEALKKYSLIGASVIICGYVVEDSFRDDASRTNYWLFRKRD
jgi:hypothetical protein